LFLFIDGHRRLFAYDSPSTLISPRGGETINLDEPPWR
jgi:hypothetical protein